MRQLALAGEGIACLADFMTAEDRQHGDLVQILAKDIMEVRQPVHAVYYRNMEFALLSGLLGRATGGPRLAVE